VQPAVPKAFLNGSAPDPKVNQLPPRQNSMLSIGEIGNRPVDITRPAFAPYSVVNAGLVPHSPEADGEVRAPGTRFAPEPCRDDKKKPQPAVAASGFDPFK